ncbi:MAG: AAA family ATPase, partial [Oligoflexia bacterium]|nr:AAA family ATPase [Oligoflexia bacterium]
VRAVAQAVLGHRVLLNFQAEAEGVDTAAVIDRILADVKLNR